MELEKGSDRIRTSTVRASKVKASTVRASKVRVSKIRVSKVRVDHTSMVRQWAKPVPCGSIRLNRSLRDVRDCPHTLEGKGRGKGGVRGSGLEFGVGISLD